MECKDIELLLIDYNDGLLDKEESRAIEKHLRTCTNCNKIFQEINTLSKAIEYAAKELPGPKLQQGFEHMLQQEINIMDNYKKRKNTAFSIASFSRFPYNIAASVILFVSGLLAGYLLWSKKTLVQQPSEITELRNEVKEMKKAVMFNLLDNASASERIKAVGYVEEIKRPDNKVIQALLQTINHDENVNVRLAALYSVAKFSDMQIVKDSLVVSLPLQKDPIIQIVMINILTEQKESRAKKAIHDILRNENTVEQVKEVAKKGLKYL